MPAQDEGAGSQARCLLCLWLEVTLRWALHFTNKREILRLCRGALEVYELLESRKLYNYFVFCGLRGVLPAGYGAAQLKAISEKFLTPT